MTLQSFLMLGGVVDVCHIVDLILVGIAVPNAQAFTVCIIICFSTLLCSQVILSSIKLLCHYSKEWHFTIGSGLKTQKTVYAMYHWLKLEDISMSYNQFFVKWLNRYKNLYLFLHCVLFFKFVNVAKLFALLDELPDAESTGMPFLQFHLLILCVLSLSSPIKFCSSHG